MSTGMASPKPVRISIAHTTPKTLPLGSRVQEVARWCPPADVRAGRVASEAGAYHGRRPAPVQTLQAIFVIHADETTGKGARTDALALILIRTIDPVA